MYETLVGKTEEREASLWTLQKKTQLNEGGLGERLFLLIDRFCENTSFRIKYISF